MTNPGGSFRPSGFLANMKAAYTPAPVTDDEANEPLVLPTTVKVSGWLALLAGIVFLAGAVLSYMFLDDSVDRAIEDNNTNISQCTTLVGGIGDSVTGAVGDPVTVAAGSVAAGTTVTQEQFNYCKDLTKITQDQIDGFRSTVTVLAIIHLVVSAGLVWAGWALRVGSSTARKVVASVTVLIGLTVFLKYTLNTLDLGSLLLLLIASVLLFSGKAARYFAIARLRGTTGPAGPNLTKG